MLPLAFLRPRQRGDLILGRTGPFSFFPSYRVGVAERAAHLYVIGISGKGKSKFLENCLIQDIAAGMGCGLIDPHSLLVNDLLRSLITQGILEDPTIREKLIYVNPARTSDFVIPFNVLATGDTAYDTAAAILEAFRRTWPESLSEAPHFSNVLTASVIALVENHLTLMDMPALLTNQDFREECLQHVSDHSIIEFFHDRYDKWGKDAPYLRESTLNKVGAFSMNPRLKLMLGQPDNRLDFRAIMDEGKILLLDLGHCDSETNRLIGSLVTVGLETAMRKRRNRNLWNLTIDEFAGYVSNEGSVKTLAHVFSEGRKFRMSMTVAHQDLSQLTPRMIGALSNVQTKVIFGIGRADAEFFAKNIGWVDTEAIKREALTETQHDLFEPLLNQWETWTNHLRFQPARKMVVATQSGRVANLWTIPIAPYQASEQDVEAICKDSLKRHGIPYAQAYKNIQERLISRQEETSLDVPKFV